MGPPYFDTVFFPLMAPAVFLMAIGPVASWKRARPPELWVRLRWALGISVVTALLLPLVLGRWSPLVAFGLWLALWVVAATLAQLLHRRGTLRTQSLSWWGMTVAHLGVAVFIFGVTLVKGYETERDLRMAPGEKTTLGGYEFTFLGTSLVPRNVNS